MELINDGEKMQLLEKSLDLIRILKFVYESSLQLYKKSKHERKALHQVEFKKTEKKQPNEYFDILGELELWSDSIVGYYSRVINKQIINTSDSINDELDMCALCNNRIILEFMIDKQNRLTYPILFQYIKNIDYLNYLIIDYIASLHPVSKLKSKD